jgi:hypothetical protein
VVHRGKQQSCIGQAVERRVEVRLRSLRHWLYQLVGEFAADHRADLRDFFGYRAEPVEAGNQRGMQCRRDRQARQRACPQYCGDAVVLAGAFEHRPGQLLNEQRHAVGARGDFRDDFAPQWRVAGEFANQGSRVALAEPIECQ